MKTQLSSLQIRATIWGYTLKTDEPVGTYSLYRKDELVCTGTQPETLDDYLTRALIANVTALPERTKQVIYKARHPLGCHG